jgi:hypothetical protein
MLLNKKEIENNIYNILNNTRYEDIYSELLFLVLDIVSRGFFQLDLYTFFVDFYKKVKTVYPFSIIKILFSIMDIIWYGYDRFSDNKSIGNKIKLYDNSLTSDDLKASKDTKNMFVLKKDSQISRSKVFIESKEMLLLCLNE